MAPTHGIPQTQFDLFYDSIWDPAADAVFIDALSFQATFGQFEPDEENLRVVKMAQYQLISEQFIEVTLADIYARIDFLEKRYVAFDTILEQEGVVYDADTNAIQIPATTLEDISKVKCV